MVLMTMMLDSGKKKDAVMMLMVMMMTTLTGFVNQKKRRWVVEKERWKSLSTNDLRAAGEFFDHHSFNSTEHIDTPKQKERW